jgi:hypothetical protein
MILQALKKYGNKTLNILRLPISYFRSKSREDKLLIIHILLSVEFTYLLFRIIHQVAEIVSVSEITLIENLLIGLLSSYYFYIIVVFIPEYQRIKIIRNNFSFQIDLFKDEVLSKFLTSIEGTINLERVNELKDIKKFREYFNEDYIKGQTRWQKVLTDIDNDEKLLKDLLTDLEFLKEECHYVLGKIQINSEWSYGFMKRLSNFIYALRTDENIGGTDMSKFFWPLFSGWSNVSGYSDVDLLRAHQLTHPSIS